MAETEVAAQALEPQELISPQDTYIPALDDEPKEPTAEPEGEPQEAAPETAEAQSEEQTEGEAEPDESWLEQFNDSPALRDELANTAKRITNLDPKNPDDLKTLRSFAEKEIYIRELKSRVSGDSPEKPEGDPLDDLKRSLLEPETEEPEAAAEPPVAHQQNGQAQEGYQLGEVSKDWRSWNDAQKDLSAAWSRTNKEGQPDPDYDRISAIQNDQFFHQFGQLAMPRVMEAVQRYFEDRVGSYMPEIQSIAESRSAEANNQFALSELTKVTGDDYSVLVKPLDGPPVVINGKEYQNTPFTQAVKESPGILKIRVLNDDPIKADRLTKIEQYEEAMRHYKRSQKASEESRQAMEAAQAVEKRTQEQRTRQSLNAGGGSGKSLNEGGTPKSYVEELNSSGSSFADF